MRNTPTLFVLFGSTGDLARSKILPAIRDLKEELILDSDFKLICVGRRDLNTEGFIEYLNTADTHPFRQDANYLGLKYVQVDFENEGGFVPLWNLLNSYPEHNIIYYNAVSPSTLELIISRMEDPPSKKMMTGRNAILIAEKPFGTSKSNAKMLNKKLNSLFGYPHIYRNDHYLKKDTVQALKNVRMDNIYIGEILNNRDRMCLEQVQILVSEKENVGMRAGYFDKSGGMLTDWFQSHMLQMLATLCAEIDHDDFCTSKAEFLESLSFVGDSLIRAQYQGYRFEEGVDPQSNTETFLAVQLKSGSTKWSDVRFKLVCGKALDRKDVSIILTLKNEHSKFGKQIKIMIDPPGGNPLLSPTVKDEYEEVIIDAINHSRDKFLTVREVEAQWQIADEVKGCCETTSLDEYTPGTPFTNFCTEHDLWCDM